MKKPDKSIEYQCLFFYKKKKMTTLTVAVPSQVAKKYGNKIVDYRELLRFIEEKMWVDVDVTPKMKMEDLYTLIKKSDGGKMAKASK